MAGTDLNPRRFRERPTDDWLADTAPVQPRPPAPPVEPPTDPPPQPEERPAPPSHRFHLSGLDGLRALAVTAVLVYHAGNNWLPGGFLGVDLFFVISGFLITTLILEEIRSTGTLSIGNFLTRRARRLLPALALVLGTTLVLSALFWRDSLAEVKSGVLASTVYVQNWWLIFHDQSYFASTGRPPPLQHLWSLSIEEQFYLLWPPIVLLLALKLRRKARLGIAVIAGVGAALSAVWMAVLAVHGDVPFDDDGSRLYFGTDTHASALLLGCAAAALVLSRSRVRQTPNEPRSRVGDVAGLAALAAFGWVLFSWSEFEPDLYRGQFFVAAALATVVVVAATRRGSLLGRALDVAPARWIGKRSYGIYLWHWPVFVVTRPVLDVAFLSAGWLLVPRLAIVVGIAALSYRFVEQPIRREGFRPWLRRVTRGHAPSRARRPALVAVGAALVLAVGFAFVRAPAGGSAAEQAGKAARKATAPPPVRRATPPPAGSAAPNARTARVTAFGDSVLEGAAPALRQVFPFLTVDAVEGRQANEVFDEVAWLGLGGRLGQIVVLEVGANGIVDAGALDDLLTKLASRKRVVLVTVHAPRLWQDPNNEIFAAAASEHPEWLYTDGTHVRPEWAYQFADVVKRAAFGPRTAKQ
jgi:peptidoglycan/LPS O-acetylase OafA/YrhL